MLSSALSTNLTTVKIPIKKTAGSEIAANGTKSHPSCEKFAPGWQPLSEPGSSRPPNDTVHLPQRPVRR
jgi:hypothetical protein